MCRFVQLLVDVVESEEGVARRWPCAGSRRGPCVGILRVCWLATTAVPACVFLSSLGCYRVRFWRWKTGAHVGSLLRKGVRSLIAADSDVAWHPMDANRSDLGHFAEAFQGVSRRVSSMPDDAVQNGLVVNAHAVVCDHMRQGRLQRSAGPFNFCVEHFCAW